MKVLAIVLLCAFAAVQGRNTGLRVQDTKAVAGAGDFPYVVHLRIAISTTGHLQTCSGSLLGASHVLTAGSCVSDLRFAWVRYGATNVIHPSLVTEASTGSVVQHFNRVDIALIIIGRYVAPTENYTPIGFLGGAAHNEVTFAGYKEKNGVPGEILYSYEVTRADEDDSELVSYNGDGVFSRHNFGAPLEKDNIQFAILVGANGENAGDFLVLDPYVDWIEQRTGLSLRVPKEPEVSEENSSSSSSSSSSSEEDSLKVRVANMN